MANLASFVYKWTSCPSQNNSQCKNGVISKLIGLVLFPNEPTVHPKKSLPFENGIISQLIGLALFTNKQLVHIKTFHSRRTGLVQNI
jgi:hypothetical protein